MRFEHISRGRLSKNISLEPPCSNFNSHQITYSRCVKRMSKDVFLSPLEPGVSEGQIRAAFSVHGVNIGSVR